MELEVANQTHWFREAFKMAKTILRLLCAGSFVSAPAGAPNVVKLYSVIESSVRLCLKLLHRGRDAILPGDHYV